MSIHLCTVYGYGCVYSYVELQPFLNYLYEKYFETFRIVHPNQMNEMLISVLLREEFKSEVDIYTNISSQFFITVGKDYYFDSPTCQLNKKVNQTEIVNEDQIIIEEINKKCSLNKQPEFRIFSWIETSYE